MSRTLLVKKLVGLVGEGEVKAQFDESFQAFTKKKLSLHQGVMAILEEAIGRKLDGEFGSALKVESHHVRRFFNKLQLGVHSVQNYLGKVLNTREEAVNYFISTIGGKAYGPDWVFDELVKRFNEEGQGVFLVTDLTLDEAKKLKTMLGSSFALVFAGDAGTEKVDFTVEQQKSKGAAKRVTISIMDKITNTETRRNTNDRPTTESQLQS